MGCVQTCPRRVSVRAPNIYQRKVRGMVRIGTMFNGKQNYNKQREGSPRFARCAPTGRRRTLAEAIIKVRVIIALTDRTLTARKVPRCAFHNNSLNTTPSPPLFLLVLVLLLGSDWPGVVRRCIGDPPKNGGKGLEFLGIGRNTGMAPSPRRIGDARRRRRGRYCSVRGWRDKKAAGSRQWCGQSIIWVATWWECPGW